MLGNYILLQDKVAELKYKVMCKGQENLFRNYQTEDLKNQLDELRKNSNKVQKKLKSLSGAIQRHNNEEEGFTNDKAKQRAVKIIRTSLEAQCPSKKKKEEVLASLHTTYVGKNTIDDEAKLAVNVLRQLKGTIHILRALASFSDWWKFLLFFVIFCISMPGLAVQNVQQQQFAEYFGMHRRSKILTKAWKKSKGFSSSWNLLLDTAPVQEGVRVDRLVYETMSQKGLFSSLSWPQRHHRSDCLSDTDVALIHQAYEKCSECSPNIGDTIRHRLGPNTYDTHQKHYLYDDVDTVRTYLHTTLGLDVSKGLISEHRPYWVVKGKANTCMCHNCEDMKHYKMGVRYNTNKISKPMNLYLAMFRIKRFLRIARCKLFYSKQEEADLTHHGKGIRILTHSKLVVATALAKKLCPLYVVFFALISVGASKCPALSSTAFPYKIDIVTLCKAQYKSDMVENLLCACSLPNNAYFGKKACYGLDQCSCKECWIIPACKDAGGQYSCATDRDPEDSTVCKECIGKQTKIPRRLYLSPSPADKLMADALFVGSIEVDGETVETGFQTVHQEWDASDTISYSNWQDELGKNTAEFTKHIVPVQQFVSLLLHHLSDVYIKHSCVLRRQRFRDTQIHRNMLPSTLSVDVDFAENGSYSVHRNAIQGAHWSNKTYTLFVMIIQCLDIDEWTSKDSKLDVGDEVSVEQEGGVFKYGVVKSHNDQTGIVTLDIPSSETYYSAPSTLLEVQREQVHRRKFRIIPVPGVSDAKHHDTYFVQAYLSKHLLDTELGWLYTQTDFNDPGLAQRITTLLFRSDGAASHFKQKGTMHYLTILRRMYPQFRIVWSVGCPGHGKGIWDGLGGVIKNKVIEHIIASDMTPKTVWEVYELIVNLFTSQEKRIKYGSSKKAKVKSWCIKWLGQDDPLKLKDEAPAEISGHNPHYPHYPHYPHNLHYPHSPHYPHHPQISLQSFRKGHMDL